MSSYVVAASAVTGYITEPSQLEGYIMGKGFTSMLIDIDTDVSILPARYLNVHDLRELAKYTMIEIDKDFASTVEPGDFIVEDKFWLRLIP